MTPAGSASLALSRKMRDMYQAQKAAGLCAHHWCRSAPVPGRVRCARHLAMVRDALRRRAGREVMP